MKNPEIIQKLIGAAAENDLKYTDCCVCPEMGIFIPVSDIRGYDFTNDNTYPSYTIIIYFENTSGRPYHYNAEITSPHTSFSGRTKQHYYRIHIEKEHFEKCFKMYSDKLCIFKETQFEICSDILKSLNLFAFEYSKQMKNSDITLHAQAEIITHWIVRSIFGETLDMRSVSDDYSVARAQHYMEQHYSENITVSMLAGLGYISASCFNRRFKKETGITPIEYLIEVRIRHAVILLRRKELPITEIAMQCGFGSSAYFSSCFQKRNGISPTEYRSRYID